MALEQEGFRWRNDDGAEEASPGASWAAVQDANTVSVSVNTAIRLRTVINHASGAAPSASLFRLEYRLVESPDGAWHEVGPAGSPDSTEKIRLRGSAFIAAGGESTSAQLTVPAGSPKSFLAGKLRDEVNGSDTISLGSDQYSELEWCIEAVSVNGAQGGDVYEFRVTRSPTFSSDVALDVSEVHSAVVGGTSVTSPVFSTNGANRFIVALLQFVEGGGVNPTSISASGGTLGSLTLLKTISKSSNGMTVSIYGKMAASQLTNEQITAIWTNTVGARISVVALKNAADLNALVADTDYATASTDQGAASDDTTSSITLNCKAVGSLLLGSLAVWSAGITLIADGFSTVLSQADGNSTGHDGTYGSVESNATTVATGNQSIGVSESGATGGWIMAAIEVIKA